MYLKNCLGTIILLGIASYGCAFTFFNAVTKQNYSAISNIIISIEQSIDKQIEGHPDNVAAIKYLPSDCSQREKLNNQPTLDRNARVNKCCPMGESLLNVGTDEKQFCTDSVRTFLSPNITNVVLYDNCIEDTEVDLHMDLVVGNPCNTSLIYNNVDDIFYVLQDGTLLIMDEFANDSYTVEKRYCLDIDEGTGITFAIVCITSVDEHLQRGAILTVALLSLLSIPCLLLVAVVHLVIKELRSLHGISLALMSLCLAIGYFTHSLVYIFNVDAMKNGYVIQYFILAYYFWYLCISLNAFLNIWVKIPQNRTISNRSLYGILGIYSTVAFMSPFIFVHLALSKGLPGMPSYFIQGITESIRESQRYFIPPVSTVLALSFLLMMSSFFGFQKMKKIIAEGEGKDQDCLKTCDEQLYGEVKKDAKCITFLGIIMISAWLLEIVTFYSPGPSNFLVLMDILNGLQGVFILFIFLVVRQRRVVILRWWYDRGSHSIANNNIELSPINREQ